MYWRAPTAGLAIVVGMSALAVSAVIAPEPLTIAEVQGTTDSTPYAGKTVTVEGVVTADLRGTDSYSGLYVQSADESSISGASDGIFVAVDHENVDVAAELAVGDLVAVAGEVVEADTQTEIVAASVIVVEPGVGVPAAAGLPDGATPDVLESLEGMLVEPVGVYTLSSTADLAVEGELRIADEYGTTLTIDDGYSIPVTGDRPFLPLDSEVTEGAAFTAPEVPMVLGQTSGGYRLEPSVPIDGTADASYSPTFTTNDFELGTAPRTSQP